MSVPSGLMSGRLWVRLVKGHRTVRDLTVPCSQDNPLTALREAMHVLDLETPAWLPSHQADWTDFGLTRFTQEHFLETVHFDRMEISYIAPETEPKKARMDIRNP